MWGDGAAVALAAAMAVAALGVLLMRLAEDEDTVEPQEAARRTESGGGVGRDGEAEHINVWVWGAALLTSIAGLMAGLVSWLTAGGRLQQLLENRLLEDGGAMVAAARGRAAYHNARAMDELRDRRARGDFSARQHVRAAELTLAGTVLHATACIQAGDGNHSNEQAQRQKQAFDTGEVREPSAGSETRTASARADPTSTGNAAIALSLNMHVLRGTSTCVLRGGFDEPQEAVKQAISATAPSAAASRSRMLDLVLKPGPEVVASSTWSKNSNSPAAACGHSDDDRVRVTATFVDDTVALASLGTAASGHRGAGSAPSRTTCTRTYTCVIRPPSHDDSRDNERPDAAAVSVCTLSVRDRAGSIEAAIQDRVLVDRQGAAYDIVASIDQTREGKCLICWDATASVIFLPCRHLVCCATCAEDEGSTRSCPACRQPVQQLLHTHATQPQQQAPNT